MNEALKHLKSGDNVKVFFADQPPKTYTIFCIADDEIMLTDTQNVYPSLRHFPGNQIIVSHTIKLNGVNFSMGDRLLVTSQAGHSIPMYISYLIDNINFILSYKKNPSRNSLKWILKMMQNSL